MILPWEEPGESNAGSFNISWESLPASPAELIRLKYPNLPADWSERLPVPEAYYRSRVAALGNPNTCGWALGRCPFHDDSKGSLAVDLWDARGYWACLTCCALGDMVDFHQRLTGQEFELVLLDLLEMRA